MNWKEIIATVFAVVALFFAFAMPGLDNPYGWPMPVALGGMLISLIVAGVFTLWTIHDGHQLRRFDDWEGK